jgi:hypothetical protein
MDLRLRDCTGGAGQPDACARDAGGDAAVDRSRVVPSTRARVPSVLGLALAAPCTLRSGRSGPRATELKRRLPSGELSTAVHEQWGSA